MDRRTFNKLAGAAVLGALSAGAQAAAHEDEIVLENATFLIAFDKSTGALTRFRQKQTGWNIQRRPDLGVSFRLHAPLPQQRDNFVLGQKQRAAKVEKLSDHRVRLEWSNLLSEHGGVLPITFTASVTLENGTLTFDGDLKNDSSLSIDTIDYPYFGDFSAPAPDTLMRTEHMWYGNLAGNEIHPHFHNEKGYWGVRFPQKTIDSKQSLFCLIQTPKEGLYVGMHDATLPYLLQFTFEQHPGVVQSIHNPVPLQDEISGITVNLEFRTCHFIFAHPHSAKKLAPVVLRSYQGDWHAGADVYKQWRATWFVAPHLPDWVKDVHSWLQLQIDGGRTGLQHSLPQHRHVCRRVRKERCDRNPVSWLEQRRPRRR
jgi:hypothetical protein